ncbi:DNA primase family protein [Stieleria varia]|uniref:SF3 helicase domain-containing protein n=1 Tax=Stieleria varia TaxID=2528005 RepID=A0A5C6AHD7_9BACT|nr:phage/plasmid primase, P4 family [Stieleria varia]TWT98585.1 hypothetical protein Pla52n_51010 [Stieleria varia]
MEYPYTITELQENYVRYFVVNSDEEKAQVLEKQRPTSKGMFCPVNRPRNGTKLGKRTRNSDHDRYTKMFVDFDLVDSDDQSEAALREVKKVVERLTELGVPKPRTFFSGRGYWLLWPCDIPPEGQRDLQAFQKCVNLLVDNNIVKVDTTVNDLARLMRVEGSINPKSGRVCEVIDNGDGEMTLEELRRLIGELGGDVSESKLGALSNTMIDLDAIIEWCNKHGHPVTLREKKQDGILYTLDFARCPFRGQEDANASLLVCSDGQLRFKCFEANCKSRGLTDLEELFGEKFEEFLHQPTLIDGIEYPIHHSLVTAESLAAQYNYIHHDGQDYIYSKGCYQEVSPDELRALAIKVGTKNLRDHHLKMQRAGTATTPKDLSDAHTKTVVRHLQGRYRTDHCKSKFRRDGADISTLFAFNNGVLDIATGELFDHDPKYFIRDRTPCNYEPDAESPRFKEFLRSLRMTEEELCTLQEYVGYLCFSSRCLQVIVLFLGATGAGKGVLARLIIAIVGGQSATGSIALAKLTGDFALENSFNKRLIIVNEADGNIGRSSSQVISFLKQMSAGDDMPLNRKNRPEITVRFSAPILMISNQMLCLEDESGALQRRMRYARFTESFAGNPDHGLEAELHAQLPGIVNWALAGVRRLELNGGRFTQPKSWQEFSDSLSRESAPLKSFIDECFELDESACTSHHLIARLYEDWNEEADKPTPGKLAKRLIEAEPKLLNSGKLNNPFAESVGSHRVYHDPSITRVERPRVVKGLRPMELAV